MSKILAGLAVLVALALISLPVSAKAEAKADGIVKAQSTAQTATDLSAAKRYRRHGRYHQPYYYGYRYRQPYYGYRYRAPYYGYAYAPYYRPYYRPAPFFPFGPWW